MYATAKKTRLLVENHGGPSSNPAWMNNLLDAVGADRCGLLLDLGNFDALLGPAMATLFGGGDPAHAFDGVDTSSLYADIEALAPRAEHVHVKAHHVGDDGAVGAVDLVRAIGILNAHGYSGALSVEYEGTGGDPWAKSARVLEVAAAAARDAPMSVPDTDFDVLIVGSGPAGSMYARTIGEGVPDATILMVEVGPAIPGARGNHTQNMAEADRVFAQLLTQGPDAGSERSAAMSDIAPGLDPSLEFRQTILPGLFFVDARPKLSDGDVGLPAASMASGVGGMGIHWGTSCPRPHQSERIPFLPAGEMDAALTRAEQVLNVTTPHGEGTGLLAALRRAIAEEFDGPGFTPTQFMPTATHWDGKELRFSGTGVILGDLERKVPGFQLRSQTLARRVIVEDGVAVGAELEDRRTGDRYRCAHRTSWCAPTDCAPRSCCSPPISGFPRSATTSTSTTKWQPW